MQVRDALAAGARRLAELTGTADRLGVLEVAQAGRRARVAMPQPDAALPFPVVHADRMKRLLVRETPVGDLQVR